MAKRRHHRLTGLGAIDSKKTVTLIAAGGLLAWLLWPKKAKAEEAGKAPGAKDTDVVPIPTAGGGMPSPETPAFKDPTTGTVIAGPSTAITPPPVGAADGVKTVERNESWSNLASRAYGDYRWWPYLWDYNRGASTQFPNPDDLKRGSTVKIPSAPPADAGFRAAIFARAASHREYWLNKARGGRSRPYPQDVLERTPLPTQSVAGLGCYSRLGYGCGRRS